MNLYDGEGTLIPVGGESSAKIPWLNSSHAGKAEEIYGNSIYAFNRSHEAGFTGVELDVRLTADNVVVVSHNGEITGTDSQGNEQTMTIISSNYDDLAELTLFTIDGVDYHLLRFDSVARMAFYWGFYLEIDTKSAANTTTCRLKAAEIIRDNGLCGKAFYITGSSSQAEDIVAIDPLAMFTIGASEDISGTFLESLPVNRVWRSVSHAGLSSFTRDEHPFWVTNAGPSSADDIMNHRPNGIQWQRDTDGVSLSEIFLANVDWE